MERKRIYRFARGRAEGCAAAWSCRRSEGRALSGSRFEDEVERCLSCAPEVCEAGFAQHLR